MRIVDFRSLNEDSGIGEGGDFGLIWKIGKNLMENFIKKGKEKKRGKKGDKEKRRKRGKKGEKREKA